MVLGLSNLQKISHPSSLGLYLPGGALTSWRLGEDGLAEGEGEDVSHLREIHLAEGLRRERRIAALLGGDDMRMSGNHQKLVIIMKHRMILVSRKYEMVSRKEEMLVLGKHYTKLGLRMQMEVLVSMKYGRILVSRYDCMLRRMTGG